MPRPRVNVEDGLTERLVVRCAGPSRHLEAGAQNLSSDFTTNRIVELPAHTVRIGLRWSVSALHCRVPGSESPPTDARAIYQSRSSHSFASEIPGTPRESDQFTSNLARLFLRNLQALIALIAVLLSHYSSILLDPNDGNHRLAEGFNHEMFPAELGPLEDVSGLRSEVRGAHDRGLHPLLQPWAQLALLNPLMTNTMEEPRRLDNPV